MGSHISAGSRRRRRRRSELREWCLPPAWLYLLIPLSLSLQVADSQRVKQGCYDANPSAFTCLPENATLLEYATGIDFRDAEEGCLFLALDVFQSKRVFNTRSLHPHLLNTLEASDPKCDLVTRAYAQCNFCSGGLDWFDNFCLLSTWSLGCGLPLPSSREKVIELQEDGYELFQSEADIDDLCEQLEATIFVDSHLDLSSIGMAYGPVSMLFCYRAFLAQHLCPSRCRGGCFTEEHPPTCDAKVDERDADALIVSMSSSYQNQTSIYNISLPPTAPAYRDSVDNTCEAIRQLAFSSLTMHTLFNVSSHQKLLQAIPGDSPLCAYARIAYPHCIWCNPDDLCFGDDHPTTCEPPASGITSTFKEDAPEFGCSDIYLSQFDDDIFTNADVDTVDNADLGYRLQELRGTARIALKNGSGACFDARRAYHTCLWCGPHGLHDNFTRACVEDLQGGYCGVSDEVEIPREYIDDLFEDPELCPIVYELMTEPDTAAYCKRFNSSVAKLGSFTFVDNFSYWGCIQKYLLSKMCPEQFCPVPVYPSPYEQEYLGASTTAGKRALIWASRVAAFFSLCGATYVMYDSLSDRKARKTVYHQLLAGMSSFDLVTAITWGFATAPIDVNDPDGAVVEGAIGNDATCTAQGFFIQLGLTSIFYSMSLACYYYLVIACGWKEFQLRKLLPFLHGGPLVVGLTLAFAAIPQYDMIVYVCHLKPPSNGEGEIWPILVYVVVPLSIAIFSITVCMIMVYQSVRRRAGASRKWSLGVGSASKMQQAVFWQALFYVLAFYITWPIMFSVYLASIDEDGPINLSLYIAFVAPLQGALNALVYARPKILLWFDERAKKRAERARQQQQPRRQTMASQLLSAINFMSPFHRYSDEDKDDDNNNDNPNATMRERSRSVDPSVAVASERCVDDLEEEYIARAEHKMHVPSMDAISESLVEEGEDGQGVEMVSSMNNPGEATLNVGAPEAAMDEPHKDNGSTKNNSTSFRDDQTSERVSDNGSSAFPIEQTGLARDNTQFQDEMESQSADAVADVPLPRPRRDYRQYLLRLSGRGGG